MALPLALLVLAGALPGIVQAARGFFPPLGNKLDQTAYNIWPNLEPSQAEIILAYYRKEISEADYIEKMRIAGFESDKAQLLFRINSALLTAADYVALWRREEISESELNERLYNLGYTGNTQNLLIKATEQYPTAQDLILFAVRDVYNPSAVAEYGLMEDYPAQFDIEARKVGLSADSAKKYWAAHWRLPSAEQGFEMFHRDIINADQLKLLLKSLDYVPKWRDNLLKLSYSPLTRVDVRRMYGFGVLDEEAVVRSYKDLGYDEKNAQALADFTIKYESKEDNGLTREQIVAAYKKHLITDQELSDYFDLLGYAPKVKALYTELAIYDRLIDELSFKSQEIIQQYKAGLITLEEARNALTVENVPAAYVDNIIRKMVYAKSEKAKMPTKADYEHWLKIQIINETQYAAGMRQIGYQDNVIQMYLTEIAFEQNTSDVKYLPEKQYVSWVKAGIMSIDDFRLTLTNKGVSLADINRFVEEIFNSNA